MPNTIDLTVEKGAGYAVIRTDGYINNIGGEQVADTCNGLIDEGLHRLVLNLTKTNIVNSVGISILIEIMEQLEETGGSLAFCGVTPTIAKTFQIMRLTDFAALHDSEEEALKAVLEG